MARRSSPRRAAAGSRRRSRRRRRKEEIEVEFQWDSHFDLRFKEALLGATRGLMAHTRKKAFGEGKRGSGKRLPQLTPEYAARKRLEGAQPRADLYRTGSMWSTFGIQRVGKEFVDFGFRILGMGVVKWRKLVKQGRNPMAYGKRVLERFLKKPLQTSVKVKRGPPSRGRIHT